jgi:nicotinamidase/pyrazinamidase
MAKSALIVVDVQRDFCEGGALAAADTLSLLEPLKKNIDGARRGGAAIVYTQDWHPAEHSSFRMNGGPWPIHCVGGTAGAELMAPLRAEAGDLVVHKGVGVDGAGYSGFEETGLAQQLRKLGVERVYVSGIATEYCVRATALDALKEGFETLVISDLVCAVEPGETTKVLQELSNAGAKIVTSEQSLGSAKEKAV